MEYGDVAKELCEQGDKLFNGRSQFITMLQELAENFYPERADFTVSKTVGEDYAASLTTSYPIMCRDELGNNISTMLRRRDLEWFAMKSGDELDEDVEVRAYLENNVKTMRNAMYDRESGFVRATKEGDHDFAAFGQCVISCELNPNNMNTLLYRNWHIRDVAWSQDYAGNIDIIHHKDKMGLRLLDQKFKGNISPVLKAKLKQDQMCDVNYRRIIIPASMYRTEKKFNTPYVSIYIDTDNKFIMEEKGVWNKVYIIPRWKTIGNSQYAISPAALTALPDARLIQSMSLILLEAGEKSVDPPMVALEGRMRSDANFYSGGITLVDSDEGGRAADAMHPITVDKSGLQFGLAMRNDVKDALRSAFYLDKIQLPPMDTSNAMTAFEVGQRVQQYISNALPLFEPMEIEYNGELCEITYDVMDRAGAFGPKTDMPEVLSDRQIRFTFNSPISETIERQKAQKFNEAQAILAQILPLDKGAAGMIDFRTALKDVLAGIGTPAKWLRSDEQMQEIEKAAQQEQSTQQLLSQIGQGAQVAQEVGNAGVAIQQGLGGGGFGGVM